MNSFGDLVTKQETARPFITYNILARFLGYTKRRYMLRENRVNFSPLSSKARVSIKGVETTLK
jgi:hypothetical protein